MEHLGHLGVDRHGDAPAAEPQQVLAHFAQHLVPHAFCREHVAAALAVVARLAELLHEVFPRAFPRHLDEAELGDLQDVRLGLVRAQRLSERAVDLVPIGRRLHVDQVDDDQSADVPEAELVDDLGNGLEVGPEDGLFQVRPPHVPARVHVDGGERFALVDDQVPARLEPDLSPQVGVDLRLDSEVVEDRLAALVAFQLGLGVGDEAGKEILHRREALRIVDDDPFRVGVGEIADHAQGKGQLRVERGGSANLILADLHVVPDLGEVPDVRFEVRVAGAQAGGPDDETQVLGPVAAHRIPQAPAFAVRVD